MKISLPIYWGEITLLHVRSKSMGYGRMGTYLHEALEAMGVDVYDKLEAPGAPNYNEYLIEEDEGRIAGAEERYHPRRHKRTNVAVWASVPSHARGWWGGQYTACMTMWEATRLPEAFRENLHEFDQLLVPSEHNLELFGRYHPNVSKVPLGIDPDVWHFSPRRKPTTTFNFLIGGSGPRKGTDLAVRAFRRLWNEEGSWGDGPEPRLWLKSPKPEDFYGRGISRIGGRISAAEEVSLYEAAHCYLQPSRGEGFGLQPLQAMAQGLPTILTDAHGHSDFAHMGWPLSTTMEKAHYFIFGDAGEWWLPSLDELCDHMRWIYDHYDAACAKAERSAAEVADRWTWADTARTFVGAIGRDRLTVPYEGGGEWCHPDLKLYRVRVNRPWQADIAGTLYQFTPGVDYYQLADVKRILFEAGILDAAILDDDDPGLTEAQVEAIPHYKAQHAYCDRCGQKLGSGISKADEIFAALEAAAAP